MPLLQFLVFFEWSVVLGSVTPSLAAAQLNSEKKKLNSSIVWRWPAASGKTALTLAAYSLACRSMLGRGMVGVTDAAVLYSAAFIHIKSTYIQSTRRTKRGVSFRACAARRTFLASTRLLWRQDQISVVQLQCRAPCTTATAPPRVKYFNERESRRVPPTLSQRAIEGQRAV